MRKHLDLVVLLLCLGLTVGVWQWGIHNDRSAHEVLGQEQVEVAKKLEDYLEHMLDYGAAVTGLYVASDQVTDSELGEFVRTMMGGDDYPAVLRFSVVSVVTAPEQETQYIVKQVVDQRGKIYMASGQDLKKETKRRKLIEQVEETGKGVIGWVDRVTNIEEYQGAGFVASSPVYREGKIVGLVNLVLSKEAIEEEIGSWIGEEVEWQWWIKDQGVVGEGETKIVGKRLTSEARVEVVGESVWGVDLAVSNLPSQTWNMVLGLGALLSFLLYAIVYALSSASARAESMAAAMTADLSAKNQFIQTILSSLTVGIAVNQVTSGKVTYMNAAFEQIYGWKREQLQSVEEFFAHVYPDMVQREEIKKRILADIESGEVGRMAWSDIEITTSTGEKRYVDARNIPLIDQNLMVSTVIDVTERKKVTDEHNKHLDEIERMNKLMVGRELKMGEMKKVLEQSLKKETLVKQADKFEVKMPMVQNEVVTKMDIKANVLLDALQMVAIVSVTDERGTITYVNDKFVEISQFSRSELIGKNHRMVKSGYHDEEFYKNMWQTITGGKIWHGEIKNKAKDGTYYWVDSSISPNFDDTGKIVGYIAIRFPITKIKNTEEELEMRNQDLEKINQSSVGRELKMVELKKELAKLKKE